MAAHWDINSPCTGTQPEAGKNLSVREALNLEKAKNKTRKSKSWKRVIYALSDFLIMILSWLVKQSLRAFLFQEVQL